MLCCACRNDYRGSVLCISPLLESERERWRRRGRAGVEEKRVRGRGSPVLLATAGLYLGSLQRQARFVSSVICSLNKQV